MPPSDSRLDPASRQVPALGIGRGCRPLHGTAWDHTGTVCLCPAPRQHPARMCHDDRAWLRRLPARSAGQHLAQALTTTRGVVGEVQDPGVNLCTRNARPSPALPNTKVRFHQAGIDHMAPAPSPEQSPHAITTLQGRGAYHLGPARALSLAPDAPGETSQLARVDLQIGLANAAALMADRARMAKRGVIGHEKGSSGEQGRRGPQSALQRLTS